MHPLYSRTIGSLEKCPNKGGAVFFADTDGQGLSQVSQNWVLLERVDLDAIPPLRTHKAGWWMRCVFCSLLLDATSADWVAKEEHAAAFLALPSSSLAPGHTLVIPTAHASGVHEAGSSSLMATMALIQKVSLAMRATLGAPGVNLLSARVQDQSNPYPIFTSMSFLDGKMTGSPHDRVSAP